MLGGGSGDSERGLAYTRNGFQQRSCWAPGLWRCGLSEPYPGIPSQLPFTVAKGTERVSGTRWPRPGSLLYL